MFYEKVKLNVPYEKAGLPSDGCIAELECYRTDVNQDGISERRRPAIVVCPGGGYDFVSPREAEPVAMRFVSYGYAAFCLTYSCVNKKFPTALLEAAAAVAYVRNNAEMLKVLPDQIYIAGFSAGGHLAASLSVHWNKDFVKEPFGFTDEHKPNGSILCYPVITAKYFTHGATTRNLAQIQGKEGDLTDEQVKLFSCEEHISADTPPAFLWHTADDNVVPSKNSLVYAAGLADHGIPYEMHIFRSGHHGLSLSEASTSAYSGHINDDVAQWVPLAMRWIANRCGFDRMFK
ncbi:MAG: alpha/beta hydrolase [Ruminococcus sp.]|jgi:acetyl esterase/lipase|nr:alpha/beta hydrolase [Ruminococcus sp.]